VIRLVGDNAEQGICNTKDALEQAKKLELDLVEISENANPPVCKIIDYKKFLYENKKKQKRAESQVRKDYC